MSFFLEMCPAFIICKNKYFNVFFLLLGQEAVRKKSVF